MAYFDQYQTETDPQDDDKVVGYRTAVAGGERKFLLSALKSFFRKIVGGTEDGIVSLDVDGNMQDSGLTTTEVSGHIADTSNPHSVTQDQVGLDQVDNTSDIDKPVSTAQQTAIDAVSVGLTTHEGLTTSVHGIADTSVLETQAGAQTKADTAEANAIASASFELASTIVDEDDMVSDSDTLVPTQQSVKAYADASQSDAEATASSALSAHNSATSVHGVDTTALALKDGTNLEDDAVAFAKINQSDIQGGTADAKTLIASKEYVDLVVSGAIRFQGGWDADTNSPDISTETTTGFAWRVDVAGTTDLGGITDWQIGDMAVKVDSGWYKIDNSEISAVWGNITGTLSNQTDLQNALDAKETPAGAKAQAIKYAIALGA